MSDGRRFDNVFFNYSCYFQFFGALAFDMRYVLFVLLSDSVDPVSPRFIHWTRRSLCPPPLILECSHLRWWRSFCFFLYLISYGVIGGCRVPLVSGRPSAGGSEGWGRGWWAEREREKMKENNFRSKLIWNRKEQKSEAQKTRRKSPIISCCYHNIKTKMIWFHFLRLFHSCIFIVFFLCVCFVLVQVSRRVGLTEGGGD